MSPLGSSAEQHEPVAIIGSGCRFPGGATTPARLWELLREPRDVLQEIPPSRFDVHGFYHPDSQFPGRSNVRHSYLLDQDVAHFDAQFFNITAAEAVAMDPQQRLLLETVYEGLETAGLTIEGLRGSDTGVYVGVMYGDYEAIQYRDLQHVPTHLAIGTARSIVSNRISYFFDWHGPSLTVDTACSSSLVALHQAVQALRLGEVGVALAAGSNLLLGPEPYIHESKLNMLSPTGRSRMWDRGANGYARGDGVGVVVLKTLSRALADGDHIEAVIRETGVNQDGRSRGITMPSADAQASLIRSTYAKAGLDLNVERDRCQYFEAHGTGTPAGDPVEAEAVHSAFFGEHISDELKGRRESPLYVGSIKTVIGHTESAAGIAGLLKVVQAMKHGRIPQNLLLEDLNPAVLPFYDNLHIPRESIPWPNLPPGHARRASVNSFGFGGTNAHVILEGFSTPEDGGLTPTTTACIPSAPFVLSAQSKQALVANIAALVAYLEQHPETNPTDLSWTLRSRRSRLPLRIALPASTIEVLQSNLKGLLSDLQLNPRSAVTGAKKSGILGVFTGQGAQWARMGAGLVETSKHADKILNDLDEALSQLPAESRPSWTLRQELMAEPSTSRVDIALISQPLCTAVQIILVELLRLAGIRFAAVVGHSSGEIAAAFAAGYLSARDAIRIAYLRGVHSQLAGGPGNSPGAMLAVGTTLEDAEELCSDEYFVGRLRVAACNSPSSVTISGDEDAIAEIMVIFEDENKFVRRLRVEKAYHSHHMIPCSQAYLDSMKGVSVEASSPDPNCTWVSSVHLDKSPGELVAVDASYWVENLLSPVLFMQAVERAVSLGPLDAAIEVGPHPALKGPVRDTLQSLGVDLPYASLLQRKQDDVKSFSDALGYLWTHLDNISIDFDRYERAMGSSETHKFLPDLPVYQWNHGQRYWNESSLSRALRQRTHLAHPLLGDMMPQSSSQALTWKAMLRPGDLPWVHDHRIQGQTVFPAAGYAVTAMETVPFIAGESPVRLIELKDFVIHQAMVFDNDDQETGIEVRSVVSSISRGDSDRITAHFTYEACARGQQDFHLVASSEITILIGEPSPQTLPATGGVEPYMVDVPTDIAYASLSDVGYGYTGPFKALSDLKRKLGRAVGSVAIASAEYGGTALTIHPAALDAAFHSIILAYSYPRDRQLRSLHLPTQIEKIRVNPYLCGRNWSGVDQVPFVASMPDMRTMGDTPGFRGDAEIHDTNGEYSAVQIEGLHVVPLTPTTAADDQQTFYVTHWIDADPDADVVGSYESTREENEVALILERGSYFYLRQLGKEIPADHPGRSDKYNAAYLNFAAHTHQLVLGGKHRYAKREWLGDTLEDILRLSKPFSDLPEIKAMHVVGEQMPRAIRGETSMLEHLMTNGLLGEYYDKAQSITQGTAILASTVAQIAQRYPRGRILEVGAGTGGATREIFKRIGNDFSTYTFTDVSTGFFEEAQAEFADHQGKMLYDVLDLEQDLQAQGFEKHAYDVVVASFVLHATRSLEATVRRIRSLLRPGGYVVLYEVTNVDIIRGTALFGCLPGWWQGIEEGRTLGACVPESRWDDILRGAGFSGIDTMTPVADALSLPNSVMVSQAVDDWVAFLREPLLMDLPLLQGRPLFQRLIVVGGTTLQVSRLLKDVQKLIRVSGCEVIAVDSLDALEPTRLDSDASVLVVEDPDQPIFRDITEARWRALRALFGSQRSILWVTQNRMIDNPFGNMAVGFARSAIWEVPELRCQFVDFQGVRRIDPRVLAEVLLRFMALEKPPKNHQDALWSVESEIVIDPEGRQTIPRLKPSRDANDRYNSAHRKIIRDVHPQSTPVTVSCTDGRYSVHQVSPTSTGGTATNTSDRVSLKLSHSSLSPVRGSISAMFIALGTSEATGDRYLGLVDSVSSVMEIPQDQLVSCSVTAEREALFLALTIMHMSLPVLIGDLGLDDTLVVHGAPPIAAELLRRHGSSAGIHLVFTTVSKEEARQNRWVFVDPLMRHSELRSLLPADVSRCVDFTPGGPSSSPLASCLPPHTTILNSQWLFPHNVGPLKSARDNNSKAMAALQQAMDAALADLDSYGQEQAIPDVIPLRDITGCGEGSHVLKLIEWETHSVPVTLRPVKARFRSDRTYWLVGLSGDLGVSIIDWMIQNGARTFVITSRSPKLDDAWLSGVARKGATVRAVCSDITDLDQLREAYSEICNSLPPIAGVYQGAMILVDVALQDMRLEEFNRVLRPKVQGTLNLERLLADQPLDFFIFLSSTATVAGNPGQAGYTSANLFMSGLALQRRERALPASVVELGLIMGTGYITREKGDVLTQPSFDRGLLTISESDVHQTLAEAVRSSHPGSGDDWQLSIGLRQMPADAPNRTHWYNYPQFACLTIEDQADGSTPSKMNGELSIKEQLSSATTSEDITRIITETFIAEMRKMLHLSDDYAITPSVRTDELGLDSLVAVRIRSWFLNHYQVNIPALRILKGLSLQELIEQAASELPPELTPAIASELQLDEEDLEDSSDGVPSSGSERPDTPDTPIPETDVSSAIGDAVLDEDLKKPFQGLQVQRLGPLSFTQSVFFFVHELLDDKTTLNNTVMIHLEGKIRVPDLRRAIRSLGKRHESLRTCIYEVDGRPHQVVLESPLLALEHRDVHTREDIFDEYARLRNHNFDLAGGQTSASILLSHSETDHYLLMSTHHIVFDRVSNDAVMADLEQLYHGLSSGPAPLQYLDYSNEQHKQYSSGDWNDRIAFWRQQYSTLPDPLPLHRSRITERRPLERYASRILEFRIGSQLAGSVRQAARDRRSTPFHFHLAAFHVLLHRFLGVRDVCIGIADSCRRDEFMHTGIGPFLNMLPLRTQVSSDQTFASVLEEARQSSLAALANSIPLEIILNELRVSRQSTHTPLAQAFMNYAENDVEDGQSFLGCRMELMKQEMAELPYDITFTVINNNSGGTRVLLNVQESHYTQEYAQVIAHGYEDILREFASDTNKAIGDRWNFRQPVLQRALTLGRGPDFVSTWPETMVHRLETLLPRLSERTAVQDENQASLSYGELYQRSNNLASELLQKGIQPGSRVAVFQLPTVDWAVSVLAILRIGATYVPLDAATPIARLSSIVKDCQPAAILAHGPTLQSSELLRLNPDVSVVDVSRQATNPHPPTPILALPDSPAIILYTSGSTGTPKGVVLQHASLKHEFDHCAATYRLDEHDVVLQQSAWSFDLSVTQIFLALGVGARLHMVSHLTRTDPRAVTNLITNNCVTVTYATPTEYKSWLRRENRGGLQASSWRLALVAGEAVTEPVLQAFRDVDLPEFRLFNVYGPTETTCGSTKMELEYRVPNLYQGRVPVGRASANECFYILDERQNLQPVGQAGEVVIGGVGVTMGYLHDEERTRASFLNNPFATAEYLRHGWKTMYRTGDLGYLEQDGTLVLLGRIQGDTSIKLNGVRIQLEDIEQTILQTAGGTLADAMVSLRSTADDAVKFMVAHVVFSETLDTDKEVFVASLLQELPLPRTMRPSAIIPVDALPRTLAGKVDRRAICDLPLPQRLNQETTKGEGLSETEGRLRDLWKLVIPEELTGLHDISASSDFFSIGGSSLLLIELQANIRKELGISVPLLKLFQSSELRAMAQCLEVQETSGSDQEIDWNAETGLLPIDTDIDSIFREQHGPPRVIVLTGATGFLGQYLLDALVQQEHVDRVICIAVRDLAGGAGEKLLSRSPKVECHAGDLRLPRLGLSEADAARIFREADAVVHNGADVSHLKTYASLRPANVASTRELARLCLPRRTPLHYVSTTGVAMYTAAAECAEASVRDAPPPADARRGGYVASKWASEVYLENVHAARGLPVCIHRPSSIVRPEHDQRGQDPVADVLQNLLNYSRRLRLVPASSGLRGFLDLVQPETVAARITAMVMDDGYGAGEAAAGGVVYVHESGDVELNVAEIRDYLSVDTGEPVREVSLEEWIRCAEDIGLSKAMAAVFSDSLGDLQKINLPRMLSSRFTNGK